MAVILSIIIKFLIYSFTNFLDVYKRQVITRISRPVSKIKIVVVGEDLGF